MIIVCYTIGLTLSAGREVVLIAGAYGISLLSVYQLVRAFFIFLQFRRCLTNYPGEARNKKS